MSISPGKSDTEMVKNGPMCLQKMEETLIFTNSNYNIMHILHFLHFND